MRHLTVYVGTPKFQRGRTKTRLVSAYALYCSGTHLMASSMFEGQQTTFQYEGPHGTITGHRHLRPGGIRHYTMTSLAPGG